MSKNFRLHNFWEWSYSWLQGFTLIGTLRTAGLCKKTSAGKSRNITSVKNWQVWRMRGRSVVLASDSSTASSTWRSVATSGCQGKTRHWKQFGACEYTACLTAGTASALLKLPWRGWLRTSVGLHYRHATQTCQKINTNHNTAQKTKEFRFFRIPQCN